eukprot:m.236191 g.236191  ORF g.236191 m.236191 type:complete len:337 (-) comp22488_c0_seq10:517-1527(-)
MLTTQQVLMLAATQVQDLVSDPTQRNNTLRRTLDELAAAVEGIQVAVAAPGCGTHCPADGFCLRAGFACELALCKPDLCGPRQRNHPAHPVPPVPQRNLPVRGQPGVGLPGLQPAVCAGPDLGGGALHSHHGPRLQCGAHERARPGVRAEQLQPDQQPGVCPADPVQLQLLRAGVPHGRVRPPLCAVPRVRSCGPGVGVVALRRAAHGQPGLRCGEVLQRWRARGQPTHGHQQPRVRVLPRRDGRHGWHVHWLLARLHLPSQHRPDHLQSLSHLPAGPQQSLHHHVARNLRHHGLGERLRHRLHTVRPGWAVRWGGGGLMRWQSRRQRRLQRQSAV